MRKQGLSREKPWEESWNKTYTTGQVDKDIPLTIKQLASIGADGSIKPNQGIDEKFLKAANHYASNLANSKMKINNEMKSNAGNNNTVATQPGMESRIKELSLIGVDGKIKPEQGLHMVQDAPNSNESYSGVQKDENSVYMFGNSISNSNDTVVARKWIKVYNASKRDRFNGKKEKQFDFKEVAKLNEESPLGKAIQPGKKGPLTKAIKKHSGIGGSNKIHLKKNG